jgi:hypothetical protein
LVLRSRFAVGTHPGFAVFPRRTDRQAVRRASDILSSSLAILQSVAQRTLAERPQPPVPLVDFGSLQHMQDSAVYRPQAFQARFVPSSGFAYPHDGFLPAESGSALFHADSARGIRPSELSPPLRWRRVSAPPNPRAVSPADFTPSPKRRAGPAGRGFRAFTLEAESLSLCVRLTRIAPVAPVGFSLSGHSVPTLAERPLPPLTRFACGLRPRRGPAPQSLSSLHLIPTACVSRNTRPRQPS